MDRGPGQIRDGIPLPSPCLPWEGKRATRWSCHGPQCYLTTPRHATGHTCRDAAAWPLSPPCRRSRAQHEVRPRRAEPSAGSRHAKHSSDAVYRQSVLRKRGTALRRQGVLRAGCVPSRLAMSSEREYPAHGSRWTITWSIDCAVLCQSCRSDGGSDGGARRGVARYGPSLGFPAAAASDARPLPVHFATPPAEPLQRAGDWSL